MSARKPWKDFAVKASIGAAAYLLVLSYAAFECIKANNRPLPAMQKLKLILPELFWITVFSAAFLLICVLKSMMLEAAINPAPYDEAAERERIRRFGRFVMALIGVLAAFFALVGIGMFDPVAKFLNDRCSNEFPPLRGAEALSNGRSISLGFFYGLAGIWITVKLFRWMFKKSPAVVDPDSGQIYDRFANV
jgi:hypothetical protein